MADIQKVVDIEKELFDLRYEVYRLRKQEKLAETEKATENSQTRPRKTPGRKVQQQQTPSSGSRSRADVADNSHTSPGSSSKAILEALEKDELLRQITDLERELVDVKQNRAIDYKFTNVHVDEARKRERKAFQTLASHDAALIAKLEDKIASLESEKEGMKRIIDELSKKAVLNIEQIEEREKLLREQTATLSLLQRELERVKQRNAELEQGPDQAEPADPVSTSDSVNAMEEAADAVSRVDSISENDPDHDSIPSPSFLDVTGPVGSGFKSRSTEGARRACQEEGTNTGLERLTTGESEAEARTSADGQGCYRDPTTPGDPLTPEALRASHLPPGDISTSYAEDLQSLQKEIKGMAASRESEKVKELKVRLKQKDAVIADQLRSFEQLVSKAQETTLLEAEEIARLEEELITAQNELRNSRRNCKHHAKALEALKKEKALLEDLLIENEASAVNQAMNALQSTATGKRSDRRQAARQPRPAMTPGALSAQDMLEVLRADTVPAAGASSGENGEAGGNGSLKGVPSWGMDTSPGAKGKASGTNRPDAGDGVGEGGEGALWSKRVTPLPSEAGKSNDNGDVADLVEAAVTAEAEAHAVAVRQKEGEIRVMRAREEELMETLEGVLRKYHSLERAIRYNHDNERRHKGMRF